MLVVRLEAVARAEVDPGPGRDAQAVGGVDVFATGTQQPTADRCAFDARNIPLCAQVELEARHAGCTLAVGGAVGGLLLLGVQPGCTGQNPHTVHRLAEQVQFDTLVDLLAIDVEHVVGGAAVRLLDAVHAEGGAVAVPVQLHTGLGLLAAFGREHRVAVARGGRRGRPLGKAFDAVGVERNVLPRLDHQTVDRCGDGFVVVGVARAGCGVPGVDFNGLATYTKGQQHAIIDKAQGVGHGDALDPVLADDARVVDVAAEVGVGRARHLDRVVQVAHWTVGHQDRFERRTLLAPHAGQAEVDLMGDRAGVEPTIQAGDGALVVFVMGWIEKARTTAAVVTDIKRGINTVLAGVLGTDAGVGGPVVVEVVLAVDHAVGVLQLRPAPVLGVVVFGRRRVRNLGAVGVDHRAAIVDTLFLVTEVGRQAQALATVI